MEEANVQPAAALDGLPRGERPMSNTQRSIQGNSPPFSPPHALDLARAPSRIAEVPKESIMTPPLQNSITPLRAHA